MFGGKKKPETKDPFRDPEYVEAIIEAGEKFPDDPLKQLEYLSTNYNKKFKVMRMLQLAQNNLSLNGHGDIELYSGTLDWFVRGMLDAVAHMKDDLPDGVYGTINTNIEPVTKTMIEYKSK